MSEEKPEKKELAMQKILTWLCSKPEKAELLGRLVREHGEEGLVQLVDEHESRKSGED